MEQTVLGDRLAKIASWAGALCVVHCVLTALALGLLSAVGLRFVTAPKLEAAFFATILVTGGVALVHGLRRHHSWVPAAAFVVGLLLIGAAHVTIEYGRFGGSSFVGSVLAVLGGLAVAAFQLLNARLQHRGCACARHGLDRKGHALSPRADSGAEPPPKGLVL